MRKRHGVLLVLVALAAAVALMFGGLAMATGETDEIISNVLTASVGITAEIEEPQVALTWALGTEAGKPDESEFSDDALELDMVIGEPIYVWVRTENQSDAPIENVLFLIETVGAGDVFTIESTRAENGNGWAGTLPYADSLGTTEPTTTAMPGEILLVFQCRPITMYTPNSKSRPIRSETSALTCMP